jgi:hypothetical protein
VDELVAHACDLPPLDRRLERPRHLRHALSACLSYPLVGGLWRAA